MNVLDRL